MSAVGPRSTMRPSFITRIWSAMERIDRQIVGDEEIGESAPLLQRPQQRQDLAPAPIDPAPKSARPAPAAPARGSARARSRCAGAGRRRTRPACVRARPDRRRPPPARAPPRASRSARSCRARARAGPRRRSRRRSGAATASRTGPGRSICIRRRNGRIAAALSACRSRPSKRSPPSHGVSRSNARASVDLPDPDLPTIPTVSPAPQRRGSRHRPRAPGARG